MELLIALLRAAVSSGTSVTVERTERIVIGQSPAQLRAPRRKLRPSLGHHPAPRGARKINPNGPLIEQARQAGGIKQ